MSITTRDLLLPAGRSNAEQFHLSWNRTSTLQMYALLLAYRMQKAYWMHLVYVNSYMALLNARHYLGSDGSPHSSQTRPPRVYCPELQVNISHELQGRSPRTSKAEGFQIYENALEHPTYYPSVVVRSKMTYCL